MIGSKLVHRQKNGLIHGRSPPSKDDSGEANDTSSTSGCQTLPATSTELSLCSSSISNALECQEAPDPTRDNHFIIMHSMNAWGAFHCIAAILQLACQQDSGFNIVTCPSTLPATIAPTLQQQIVPHKPYVDMLPWPGLRDRILNSFMTMNEEEFVQDMGSTDLRVWGSTPWEPLAWEIGPIFARKWWFLMDEGILHPTNFWRGQRGEEALIVAQLQP